jgi:uncharacterized repeat protein (TIGR03847 family)
MSNEPYELNPVTRITVGVVGRPGQRRFFLQASQSSRVVTLKLEKEQVFALAKAIDEILENLEQREIRRISDRGEPATSELGLEEPIEPAFAVGQMGLGFDEKADLMVLIAQGVQTEEQEEPQVARFWASPEQMRAVSQIAKDIVAQGRPICPLCQRPMDPEGHLCPRRNGHSRKIVED